MRLFLFEGQHDSEGDVMYCDNENYFHYFMQFDLSVRMR